MKSPMKGSSSSLRTGSAGPAGTWMIRGAVGPGDDVGQVRVIAAREDVDLEAEPRQEPRELADVHVLAAAVDPPE